MIIDELIIFMISGQNFENNSWEKISEKISSLDSKMIAEVEKKLQLTFVSEKEDGNLCFINNNEELQDAYKQTFTPSDLTNYIFAVLCTPQYKVEYKEFLNIDLSLFPYPKKAEDFWKLVKLGGQLRRIDLLEKPALEKNLAKFLIDGDTVVQNPKFIKTAPAMISAVNSSPINDVAVNSLPSSPDACNGDAINSHHLEGCPKGGVVNSGITTPIPSINFQQSLDYFTINNIIINHHKIIELPYNPKLKERAKELRKAKNLSEVLFWTQVNKKQFHEIDFDRQRIIGNYIVDFYVKKLGLIIEIDGTSHDEKVEYDSKRENYLKSLNLKIYRIPVDDILNHLSTAMQALENFIIENYSASMGEVENVSSPFTEVFVEKQSDLLLENISQVEKPSRPLGTPPEEGNLVVDLGRVYINETQYFENVPETAWNFNVGGYQPAKKWLKDRKGKTLKLEDTEHYQKIIVALFQTDRLIKKISKIEIN